MKTLEEHALTHTRKTLFYTIDDHDLSETFDELEVDYLISELQTIQEQHKEHKLVLRTDTVDDSNTVMVTVGYYDLEPMQQFETRVKSSYDTYVYCETSRLKARMTPAERKAFEIKELEERLAQLKDNA
jgi:uncharacterized Ntn-hydrolase superfamily protein